MYVVAEVEIEKKHTETILLVSEIRNAKGEIVVFRGQQFISPQSSDWPKDFPGVPGNDELLRTRIYHIVNPAKILRLFGEKEHPPRSNFIIGADRKFTVRFLHIYVLTLLACVDQTPL
jgi:hypothetical protein